MSPALRCMVFDFAGTLCSTPYFWPLGPEFLAVVTEAVFTGENKALWAGPWCRGEIGAEDIAEYLSGLTGLTTRRILEGLERGCSDLAMNPAVWRFAREQRARGRRAVLATVNMDVFTRIVTPAHGLHEVFDAVMNSADCGTEDKNALCQAAFNKLDGCCFGNSLLIDDSAKAVESFRSRGGRAHRYTCDEAFAEWVQTLED